MAAAGGRVWKSIREGYVSRDLENLVGNLFGAFLIMLYVAQPEKKKFVRTVMCFRILVYIFRLLSGVFVKYCQLSMAAAADGEEAAKAKNE